MYFSNSIMVYLRYVVFLVVSCSVVISSEVKPNRKGLLFVSVHVCSYTVKFGNHGMHFS